MRSFLRQISVVQRPLWSPIEEEKKRVDPGIDPASLGTGIIYLNSTLGLAGAHNSAVATWPEQFAGRNAIQGVAAQRPALQTTSNLSPLGRQMVLFGGTGASADNMFFGTDLPARTELTIMAYGRGDVTGIGALTQCYPIYAAQTGDRPDLKVRSHSECLPGGADDGSAALSTTTGPSHQWGEFVLQNGVHRFWAWRFAPPEGAAGVVSMWRGDNAALTKGTDKAGWGWTETSADGYHISRPDGNAGYRGTIGIVLRYHTAFSDATIQGVYQWIKVNFGYD